jgi:predicted amidohydrolase YtcJ
MFAHTVNAAFQIGRDHDLGSIEVGKFADFVELSAACLLARRCRLLRQALSADCARANRSTAARQLT